MMPFVLSLIYLLYLSLICQTLFIYDSIGYERLGERMLHHGLITYIQNGPEREPLYILVIAAAMRLAEVFSLDARWALKLLQIALLAATQILAFFILKGLRVNGWCRSLAVLYIGISPALVNSALWVYSEIAALPLVLAAVLASAKAWADIHGHAGRARLAVNGTAAGTALALCMFVKGIFEMIAPLLMLPFVLLAMRALRKDLPRTAGRAMLVVMCCAAAFYIPVTAYKYANLKLNGHFTFTDRGAWALYGNTARRVEPLTVPRLKAALAYIPSPHLCYVVMDQGNCDFWSYKPSDNYGRTKLQELYNNGTPKDRIDPELMRLSVGKAMEHPLQYAFLAFLETLKMLFWETSKAGQVMYPDWVDHVYHQPWFDPALVTVTALLSLWGLVYLTRTCWRNRDQLHLPAGSYSSALALFLLLMLLAYAFAHSFFFVLQRYSLPAAPLWVIAAAFRLRSLRQKI